ncbi:hypothetical protein BH10PSE6_BH10PSE6_24470 [soil metagenome]
MFLTVPVLAAIIAINYVSSDRIARTVIRLIEADGWSEVAQRGSHKQFKHPTKPGKATVPHPKKDIPLPTPRSIERQTGVTLR